MKRVIKNTMSCSVICFMFMTVFACGGNGDEARMAGGGLESGGEAVNPGGEFRRAHVCVLEMNFRTEPDADAPRVKSHEVLYWGVEFDVLAEEGDWVRVRLDDRTEGWLRAEYEGNIYVKDVADIADPSGVRHSGKRPIDSREFLEKAGAAAEEWKSFYNELDLLCGSYGGLGGRCYEWTAFYTSIHNPGKKLWCSFDASDPGDGFRSEEWDADWEYHGGVPRDDAGVAPGPAWRHYEDREVIRGSDFISTAELCKPANLDGMVAAAKREIPVDLASVAGDYGGFDFVLDRDRWLVGIRTHTESYNFYFDARTGEFVEFELVEFEGP